jgi:hypothetical protein
MLLQTKNKGDFMSIQITEGNPLHFLQAIEDAILDGFYADTSIPSYPMLTTFPYQIRLFKSEKPVFRFDLGSGVVEANIAEYDPLTFILNFQSAVLQGFSVQDSGTGIDPVGLKTASMRRSVQTPDVVLDLGKQASEEPTEAPKPVVKQTRKPTKSKEV